MNRKKTPRKNKRIQELYDKIGPTLTAWSTYGLLFIGILLSLSLFRNVSTIISADKTIAETQERLDKLKIEHERLAEEVEKVQSPDFKETESRDKLGLAKSGETILVLPAEDVVRKISPVKTEKQSQELPSPNWQKWLKLFL